MYEGFENFERAYARRKGVLFLTAHLGAWELSAFAHSLQGHPLAIVMRSLDNSRVDHLIQSYRTMHGNRTVDKDDFVRGLLAAMRDGETVGILMDTNMTPPQGVFVDFFGIPACTASGLAPSRAPMPPSSPDSPCGTRSFANSSCDSMQRSNWSAPATIRPTSWPTPRNSQNHRRLHSALPDQWLWVHRR